MWRKMTGGLAAAGLAVVGAQHMVWAFSPWPFGSRDEVATYVLGQTGDMPPRTLTFALGVVLAASALPVLASARLVPRIGPVWPHRLTTWGLTAVLLARGVCGPLFNAGATDEFVTWNLRLYSPLCLALAACIGSVAYADTKAAGPETSGASTTREPVRPA
ncbi:DUF3995 domain-containing protein [Actinomadura macra]|uniref:DUF3995 domain-containing protein n=1 Tax=Actinomadura macra TaxID=46164 RepID=UPI00083320E3|nr:DUF3995 domain-containing protein [Actinomadura macra]